MHALLQYLKYLGGLAVTSSEEPLHRGLQSDRGSNHHPSSDHWVVLDTLRDSTCGGRRMVHGRGAGGTEEHDEGRAEGCVEAG